MAPPFFFFFLAGTYILFSCTPHFLMAMSRVVCVEGPASGCLLVAKPVLHQGPRPIDEVHSLCMDHSMVVSLAALLFFSFALEPMLCFPARHASRWPRLRFRV